MSDQTNPKDYYTDTAYKPAKRVAWEEANPDRQRIRGSRLTWYRRTPDNGTKDEYGYNNIEISERWESIKAEGNLEGSEAFKEIGVHYDHEAILPPSYKKISGILFTTMGIGKGGAFLSLWVFFIMSLGLSVKSILMGELEELIKDIRAVFIFVSPVFLSLVFLWKGGRLLEKLSPEFFYGMRKAPVWQLNRQNGFFTIYNPKRAWEEHLIAPIYEFDAYLESSPDTQGSPTYSLMLYHPETGLRQKLDAQFPPTNMPGELVAAWQFIQRYMDVSQPLPDVPALEIHRFKDPTTAAADKRKGRNPRYWRDMSEAEVEKIQEEKYQKNIRLR
ncbi:hypothetical protein [Vreelandella titanicae]|uniref:Uncharacterized protein n=1 Tax=Vreelandella titanicae TaxID=664683 RepID=A0A558J833_9GAMM|nr:hypothetical protein [Halomonas titanicae]TVU89783.1 hypothetical protein FQP89_10625 [Halomonas titanicae]